jgi:hypothetical protein
MLMRRVINMRTSIFASIILASLGACAAQDSSNLQPGDDELAGETGDGEAAKADAAHDTFGYVSIHRMNNPQTNPLFGANYSVERTNRSTIKCNDGTYHDHCGVHAINWGSMSQSKQDQLEQMLQDEQNGVRTGTQIIAKGQWKIYVDFSAFEVSEVWAAQLKGGDDSGTFVQVFDRGIRCITAPCPQFEEDKLNSTKNATLDSLDYGDSATDALQERVYTALTSTGAIVAGYRETSGTSTLTNVVRSVNQVYLPVK